MAWLNHKGGASPLIAQISRGARRPQAPDNPYPYVAFSPAITDVRTLIFQKNAELIAKNPKMKHVLRSLNASNSDRELEEIFAENYYKTISRYHCVGAITFARIALCALGWKTSIAMCLSAETFLGQVADDAADDIVLMYSTWLRPAPECITSDCAKMVLQPGATAGRRAFSKVAASVAKVVSAQFGDMLASVVTSAIGTYLQTTSATWQVLTSTGGSLDGMLVGEVPVGEIDVTLAPVLDIVRGMCRRSIEEAAKAFNSQTRRRAPAAGAAGATSAPPAAAAASSHKSTKKPHGGGRHYDPAAEDDV